jgi:DNA-directed RNA polymerase beta subunit
MMTARGTFIINGTERIVVEPARALARRLLRHQPDKTTPEQRHRRAPR